MKSVWGYGVMIGQKSKLKTSYRALGNSHEHCSIYSLTN